MDLAAEDGSTVKEMAGLDYADLSLQQLMDIKLDAVYGASKFDQKVSQALPPSPSPPRCTASSAPSIPFWFDQAFSWIPFSRMAAISA
ncbi:MAG: hypothetical protein U0984_04065 [Prosthecobacter sp.]|nr:hypothetical protein [Prosthecobacter sp.]